MRLMVDVKCEQYSATLCGLMIELDDGTVEPVCPLETFVFFDNYGDQHVFTNTVMTAFEEGGELLVHSSQDDRRWRRQSGSWGATVTGPAPTGALATLSVGLNSTTPFDALFTRLELVGGRLEAVHPTSGARAVVPLPPTPDHQFECAVFWAGAVVSDGSSSERSLALQAPGSRVFERVTQPALLERLLSEARSRRVLGRCWVRPTPS
jgi:hypothetical protein